LAGDVVSVRRQPITPLSNISLPFFTEKWELEYHLPIHHSCKRTRKLSGGELTDQLQTRKNVSSGFRVEVFTVFSGGSINLWSNYAAFRSLFGRTKIHLR
jgi:hypothetical protein